MTKQMMITAAVAVFAFPAFASAQSSVTATATVAPHSAVTGTGNLVFGTLTRGADKVIAATGASAATRTVEYNHNVTVTVAAPTALAAGTLSLPVAITCAAKVGTSTTWTTEAACTSFNLDVGTGLTSSVLGFGGTITGASTDAAAAGDYTGTISITVAART